MTQPIGALIAVLALAAAACGSDDGTSTGPATSPLADSGAGTATTTPEPSAGAPVSSDAPTTSTTTSLPTAAEIVGANDAVRDEIVRVAGTDEDGPFYMVNLLDFHDDQADYPPDSQWFGSTAAEANSRYAEVVLPALQAIGAAPVFVGDVEQSLISGQVEWDQVGIVRYPSRAALLEMSSDPEFVGGSVHKDASLANTFALLSDRMPLEGAPPDPDSLPFPPTDDDPGFMMVHVIDFRDEAQYQPGEEPEDAPITGEEAVSRYTANAGLTAAPLGVRPRAWFAVQGAVLGEHQRWQQVRLNEFPSRATFQALTSDPGWASGQYHRTAGIAETYALITRPVLFDRTFAEPDQQ